MTVSSYTGYCVDTRPVKRPAQELQLKNQAGRTVFFRDEKIVLTAELINRSSRPFPAGPVLFSFEDSKRKRAPGTVPAFSSVSERFEIDGMMLRPGKYTASVRSGTLSGQYDITVVSRPPEDLYAFYNWSDGNLEQMNANHFNGVSVNISPKDDFRYLRKSLAAKNDYAMEHDMKLGIHIPLLSKHVHCFQDRLRDGHHC